VRADLPEGRAVTWDWLRSRGLWVAAAGSVAPIASIIRGEALEASVAVLVGVWATFCTVGYARRAKGNPASRAAVMRLLAVQHEAMALAERARTKTGSITRTGTWVDNSGTWH